MVQVSAGAVARDGAVCSGHSTAAREGALDSAPQVRRKHSQYCASAQNLLAGPNHCWPRGFSGYISNRQAMSSCSPQRVSAGMQTTRR